MSPFAVPLAQVTGPLELLWVLALTPFYAVYVLFVIAGTWMIRFYCLAFAVLLLALFISNMHKSSSLRPFSRFDTFWFNHTGNRVFSATILTKQGEWAKRIAAALFLSLKRFWAPAVAVVLVLVFASTFVSASLPRNPSFDEAARFIATDNTNFNEYSETYRCANFARDFQANALKSGLNCGYVTVLFPDLTAHALNCFNTTDRGIVYVEPQTDQVINLWVGEEYSGSDSSLQVADKTVTGFYIDWEL